LYNSNERNRNQEENSQISIPMILEKMQQCSLDLYVTT